MLGAVVSSRATYKYFGKLDAIRGVAAVIVMLYHFNQRVDLPFLFPHGYLSVDLFFALSGFVMAHAYGTKITSRTIGVFSFLVIRLIRLMPMIVLGMTVGVLIALMRQAGDASSYHVDIVVAWFKGCLLIPTLVPTTPEYVLFPLNGPIWSVFFEIIANGLFAIALRLGAGRRTGVLIGTVSFCALAWFVVPTDNLPYAGVVGDLFIYGFPRVGLSFCIGLALYGARRQVAVSVSGPLVALLLGTVCAVPRLAPAWDGVYDLMVIVIVCPIIIMVSAAEQPPGVSGRITAFFGLISYPLYALHYPVVRAVSFVTQRYGFGFGLRLAVVAVTTLGVVILAAVCARYYDEPIRQWLRRLSFKGARIRQNR